MNIDENSIQVSENYGIVKFLKKITNKKEVNYNVLSNFQSNNNLKSSNFLNSIKYEEDPDKKNLFKIQEKLERIGISKENVFLLTKDLSVTQKKKLLELYKEQINSLNSSVNNYKSKIIKIRKSLKGKKQHN